MTQNIVIVGGGITGLMTANILHSLKVKHPIYIVETSPEVGGLLRSFNYKEYGYFDYGMHFFTDTGIDELDQLQWQLLPEDEWHHMTGLKHSVSGAFFAGQLQVNSHYPDLRHLNKELYQACISDFFIHLQRAKTSEEQNILDTFTNRFGPIIAQEVLQPIIEKIHQFEPSHIHSAAIHTPHLDRVIMFDEPVFQSLMGSEFLRQRLAYPEQRHLPAQYSSGLACYYPRKYGTYRVIDSLKSQLLGQGTHILTNTSIKEVNYQNNQITALKLGGQENGEIDNISHLYWTANLPALSRVLQLFSEPLDYHPPLQTVLVNLILNQPIDAKDLYHFFCLDPSYHTYRVTNYPNYCPESKRMGGFPLCVELLMPREHALSQEALCQLALKELSAFGVLQYNTEFIFSRAETLAYGFPFPMTLQNMASLDQIRSAIHALELNNMTLLGILSQPHLFFQPHLLANTYKQVVKYG